jgi:RNA polymerase sigma factor (sigma-70 family)
MDPNTFAHMGFLPMRKPKKSSESQEADEFEEFESIRHMLEADLRKKTQHIQPFLLTIEDVEDLVSSGLYIYYRRKQLGHEIKEIVPYVRMKVRNRLNDVTRKRKAEKNLVRLFSDVVSDEIEMRGPISTFNVVEEVARRELAERLGGILDEFLTKHEKIALQLRYGLYDGEYHNYAEIGQILNMSGSRTSTLVSRAKRKLELQARLILDKFI